MGICAESCVAKQKINISLRWSADIRSIYNRISELWMANCPDPLARHMVLACADRMIFVCCGDQRRRPFCGCASVLIKINKRVNTALRKSWRGSVVFSTQNSTFGSVISRKKHFCVNFFFLNIVLTQCILRKSYIIKKKSINKGLELVFTVKTCD